MTDITRRTVLAGAGLATLAVTGGTMAGCSTAPAGTDSDLTTTDVPVGSGLIQSQGDYVITQPTSGQFRAFEKICPHAGCAVGEIQGTNIVCGCHGSRFDLTTGEVVQGPATTGLTEVSVAVEGDRLTVG